MLAVWAAKISEKASVHIFHRQGVTWAGKIALKIDPSILHDLAGQVRKDIFIVCGTNGKTTTNNMLCAAIEKEGYKVICNHTGSNMLNGVVAAFVLGAGLSGNLDADYACIEIDEASTRRVFPHFKPDYMVLTNLFRDQLDRYGEVTHTLNAIKESVKNLPNAIVCLDADCSLTYSMSKEIPNKIITFGVNVPFDKNAKAPEISDAKYCIFCKHEYDYTYHTYGHLGGFVCNNCGYKRPQPDFAVESVEEMKNDHSVVVANLNGDRNIIKVNIGGAYNIYNAIGCAAALTALGIEQKNIIDAIENFNGAFGRMEHFKAGNNTVNLILVKNPAGFSQTMNFLKSIDDDFTLILSLNDNAADGRDISWIWDVDFSGIFDKPNVKELYVTGKRCYDMAVRVKYEGIGNREIKIIENEDYNKLVDVATSQGRDVYIVPTYTSMMSMRPVIAKRLGGKDFWE